MNLHAEFIIQSGTLSEVQYLEDGSEEDVYHGEVNDEYVTRLTTTREKNGFSVDMIYLD